MRTTPLALAALMIAPATAVAQQVDAQAWLQVNARLKIDDRWSGTIEGIARAGDRQDGLYMTEIGGILAYRPSKAIELGFGYRHVGFHGRNSGADEDRFRQHIALTLGRFSSRLRLDERFHPGGSQIGFRIRPLVRYTLPIGSRRTVFVSHEDFLLPNSTRWGQRTGWERMRNIIGVTLPLGSTSNIELGYLNQYRFARSGARSQMDHALNVQINLGFQRQPRVGD